MGDRLIRKGLVLGIIILLFIGSNFVSGLNVQLKNTTIPLITGRGYIQGLIDNATDGDTIYVPSGIYYEHVFINKSISLVGEDKNTTIIDGLWNGDVVSIFVDWVNISMFTIRNSGEEWNNSGIKIFSNNTTIIGNNISNNQIGIHVYKSNGNNVITDNTITNNNECGIYLQRSSNNNVIGNNIRSQNGHGIYIWYSSNNNTITGNNISSNNWWGIGIDLYQSSGNIIIGNNIILMNNEYGNSICLEVSSDNIITGNTMVGYGISIQGEILEYWNTHIIDISNTVNGKPVIYWKNQIGGTIPAGAGQVILANCTNVLVENQNFNSGGIELGFTSGCVIIGNNISINNWCGIYLYKSSGNTITSNNISNNIRAGIYLYSSNKNNITRNNVIKNDDLGIILEEYSQYNTITYNIISNHNFGLYVSESSFNIIQGNTINLNYILGIYIFYYSTSNTLKGNIVSNSDYGISIGASNLNTIMSNTIKSNNLYGIEIDSSYFTTIMSNTIKSNGCGVLLYLSNYNFIIKNNLLKNNIEAFFEVSFVNLWSYNYWNRPRLLPILIPGIKGYAAEGQPIKTFNIDWRPALKPYDIGV